MGNTIIVRPAATFSDVQAVLGPKNPDSNVCNCLSYRLGSKENNALKGPARIEKVRELCARAVPPGVLAYDGDVPVGWAAVHPRSETSFARNRKIPHVDDRAVWSVWCFRVVPKRRGQGITRALLDGAVEFAREHGAPVIEGYPLDNQGERANQTMAYVGMCEVFESAGFVKVADTDSVLSGVRRVIMRREL